MWIGRHVSHGRALSFAAKELLIPVPHRVVVDHDAVLPIHIAMVTFCATDERGVQLEAHAILMVILHLSASAAMMFVPILIICIRSNE